MTFSTIFKTRNISSAQFKPPILLDGGLGTTLEDIFLKDITHPLWSAKLIDNEEDDIVAAHLAFLQAGSQVILTSTYQAAYETFHRAHYTTSEAERLMLKSVGLAVRAREKFEQFQSQTNGSRPRTKIALSLGPYGATLEPTAEFTGIYPSPYGPSHDASSSILNQAHEPQSLNSNDTSCTNSLAAFHFSRLLVYARNSEVWNSIDLLAFETIPLVTEANAIRIAVARLERWFQDTTLEGEQIIPSARMKPWYISFVFPGPNGQFIQNHSAPSRVEDMQIMDKSGILRSSTTQRAYTPYEIAQAALSPEHVIKQQIMAIPDAIGVNCTPCNALTQIIEGFASAVRDLSPKILQQKEELPWLVLYPNGGLTYDSVERTWVDSQLGSQECEGTSWAEGLANLIQRRDSDHPAMNINLFEGVLIGGCCKTGPEEINALKSQTALFSSIASVCFNEDDGYKV